MNPAVEVAMQEWEAGERRLAELETTAARRAILNGVVAEIADELRRRMGHAFDLAALSDEYAGAGAWCLDVAQRMTCSRGRTTFRSSRTRLSRGSRETRSTSARRSAETPVPGTNVSRVGSSANHRGQAPVGVWANEARAR